MLSICEICTKFHLNLIQQKKLVYQDFYIVLTIQILFWHI